VQAELSLGYFHEQGVAGTPNLGQAVHWYSRAAKHGSSDGQVALATAYYLGRGAPLDMEQAAHWYREAAKGGDVGAQYLLASMYETGLGLPADLRLARYWYDIAARNGDEAAPAKVKDLDKQLAPDAST
jgi:TPR repeat protein